MTIKFTMLMELTTNAGDDTAPHRIGGWSETWYFSGITIGPVIDQARFGDAAGHAGLLPTRADLLPAGASIVGQRFQQVDPTGASQSTAFRYPGSAGSLADVPQMALLFRVPGLGVNNVRRSTIRGVPDARVVTGEYAPSAAYTTALNRFFTALGAWRFRGRDLSSPSVKIFSITSVGVVTTEVPHGFLVNDIVRIMRTERSDGILVGGRFMVSTVGPGTNTFTVANWTQGATTGGKVRKDGVVYPQVDSANISLSRVVTRRVGRPFTQYRGRRSARQKV